MKPYLIIPNLILQPTWGGNYIASFKGLNHDVLKNQKIGQSYELYESTNLSNKKTYKDTASFEIGDPENPEKTHIYNDTEARSLKELIAKDPKATLGSKALALFGKKMGVLIKFTQAKGNSFQLHVKKDTKAWLTKPESWYYFEKGYITLGVKPGCDFDAYKRACEKCYLSAQNLSKRAISGEISISEAENLLAIVIKAEKIESFVNYVEVDKDDSIDLSACGIHHSWEEDEERYPLGNVVYEVQKNAYDPKSTIRSFDKGKFKSDGSIRTLQIDDYFTYLDRGKSANNPNSYKTANVVVDKGKTYTVTQVFKTAHYQMQSIEFQGELQPQHSQTKTSFHHVFVKDGSVAIESEDTRLEVLKGNSAFIPAVNNYKLSTQGKAVVLKTFV